MLTRKPSCLQGNVQVVARMPQFAGPRQSAHGDEVLQIPGCGRARRPGDADVVFRAQAALKPGDSFAQHAGNHFVLSLIQLAAQFFIELRLGEVEIDAPDRRALRLYDRVGEVRKPSVDLDLFVVVFERAIIRLALAFDRVGERYQGRLAQVLGKRFF